MLNKKYNHKQVEFDKYNFWLNNDYFKANQDQSKEPFCIVIPPPNVTGKLHLGHAWDTALQDIIIRYKRMQGFDTLWLPGMDHAGIATQTKIDHKLKEEGINPREMSRDCWLSIAWDWKKEYAEAIRKQWAKLGLSLDYSRERFTLDEGLSKAVNKVFIDLYNQGLIYRGERIINWDPDAKTALSNEEVIYKDIEGYFYYLKYFIVGTDDYLTIATTRPETLFGDTAVAVNPNDKRYKHLIGQKVILPLVNKEIPIIGDDYADPQFGTGVVKITPAHDPNDFEVGNRHNLERIVIMTPDARMSEKTGKYKGMDRYVCREEVIKDLKKQNLYLKEEKIIHSVGHSERTEVMVEPYLSKQWFVKMRPLANKVLINQTDIDNKVNFIPNRYEKVMNHWMEITYDWCISRQLWWGHRIPAWYKNDQIYIGEKAPNESGWIQDEDVLDTWFSSALWPFSTLGWPKETADYKRYYPNSCLVTGYDIIPFWVNRMTFQALHFTNQRPFENCLIHGLIRDKTGRKMSKSLGNGIDPMDVIEKYGADALRYFLTTNSSPGMDLRYDEEKLKATWNFINKLWNAARFVLLTVDNYQKEDYQIKDLTLSDKWILTKLNETIKNVTKSMDQYDFHIVGNNLYSFIWNDFCDWYIELSKNNPSNTTKNILLEVLIAILKMLHPFMPYVTEEIYNMLPNKSEKSIMITKYPIYDKNDLFKEETQLMELVIKDIVAIRNLKLINKIPKNASVDYAIKENVKDIFINLLKIANNIPIKDNNIKIKYESSLINITYYFEGQMENLIAKENEIKKLQLSIKRREALLNNPNYVNKAPIKIVELDQQKLKEEQTKLKILLKEE